MAEKRALWYYLPEYRRRCLNLIDLLFVGVVSLLLSLLATVVPEVVRIILGAVFLLFFPGYALVAALFPGKDSLTAAERVALSFGLSVVVVPLIGLVLNYTLWGVRLNPVLFSVLTFVVVASIVAWYRRMRLVPERRFWVSLRRIPIPLAGLWKSQGIPDKILNIVLLAAVAGAVGTLAFFLAVPKQGERFTEFYVLDLQKQVSNYPSKLTVGQQAAVILRIVNREGEATTYRVDTTIEGKTTAQIGPVSLASGEKWEQRASFSPTQAGTGEKVEFLLYKGSGAEPYRAVHIWVDVSAAAR